MPAWRNKKTAAGAVVVVVALALMSIIGGYAWSDKSRDPGPPDVAVSRAEPADSAHPTYASSAGKAGAVVPASVFMTKRPGDVLNRYLGVVQSDALHERIRKKVGDERAKCYTEHGLAPPAEDAVDEPRSRLASLKGNDIAAFRSQYGFGVVEEYLEAQEATRKASAAPAPPPSLSKEQVAKAEQVAAVCAARTAGVINDSLAPAQMHTRTVELMREFGGSKAYRDFSEAWKSCMASAGFRTPYGPYEARVVAEDYLQTRLQEAMSRSFGRTALSEAEKEAMHESTTESFQAIPGNVRAELRELEMRIYAADARCLSSSGAGRWMSNAENEIMRTLQQEFPQFSGVDHGPEPAGMRRQPQ